MGYTVSGSDENQKTFIPASQGVHNAVCVDIVDEGMITNLDGKEQHKCRIVFEIEETNEEGIPLTVSNRYTVSLHKSSNLRPLLEKWRGRPFTEAEMDKFDLERLIGVPAQIVVSQNQREDRVYANVDNILKSVVQLQPSGNYVRRKDRDDYLLPARSPWNPQQPRRQQTQQRPNNPAPQQQQRTQPQRQQSAAPQPQRPVNRPQAAPAQETESVPAF